MDQDLPIRQPELHLVQSRRHIWICPYPDAYRRVSSRESSQQQPFELKAFDSAHWCTLFVDFITAQIPIVHGLGSAHPSGPLLAQAKNIGICPYQMPITHLRVGASAATTIRTRRRVTEQRPCHFERRFRSYVTKSAVVQKNGSPMGQP